MNLYDFKYVSNQLKDNDNVLFCGTDSILRALDFAQQTVPDHFAWYTIDAGSEAVSYVYNVHPEYIKKHTYGSEHVPGVSCVVCPVEQVSTVNYTYPGARVFAYTKMSSSDWLKNKQVPACFLTNSAVVSEEEATKVSVSYSISLVTPNMAMESSELLTALHTLMSDNTVKFGDVHTANGIITVPVIVNATTVYLREDCVHRTFTCYTTEPNAILFTACYPGTNSICVEQEYRGRIDVSTVADIYGWFRRYLQKSEDHMWKSLSIDKFLLGVMDDSNVFHMSSVYEDYVQIMTPHGMMTIHFSDLGNHIFIVNIDEHKIADIDYMHCTPDELGFTRNLRKILRKQHIAGEYTLCDDVRKYISASLSFHEDDYAHEGFRLFSTAASGFRCIGVPGIHICYDVANNSARLQMKNVSDKLLSYMTFLYADYIHDALLEFDIKLEV